MLKVTSPDIFVKVIFSVITTFWGEASIIYDHDVCNKSYYNCVGCSYHRENCEAYTLVWLTLIHYCYCGSSLYIIIVDV